jgi:hypothetical protein
MSSRGVFYTHVLILLLGAAVGMSESSRWLEWAQLLIVLVLPMMLVNVAMPFAILALARKEKQPPRAIVAAVILSAAMTVAWFFVILPLCS